MLYSSDEGSDPPDSILAAARRLLNDTTRSIIEPRWREGVPSACRPGTCGLGRTNHWWNGPRPALLMPRGLSGILVGRTNRRRTGENMAESDKQKSTPETELLSTGSPGPLVFISHDGRDAELAEAFSKLLKSVSAGMIKTFRSSDKKGTEGIDFGEEWYKRLMTQLQSTSDVVCLFTERSLDRPWILFEAGVAKGKLNTPVLGVALGVPQCATEPRDCWPVLSIHEHGRQ